MKTTLLSGEKCDACSRRRNVAFESLAPLLRAIKDAFKILDGQKIGMASVVLELYYQEYVVLGER